MWSIGTILAELLNRRPLFPGKDTQHQLELIVSIIGSPTEEEIQAIPRPRSRDFIRTFGKRPPRQNEKMFPNANPLALDLLKKLLAFDSSKRLTVEQALEHPYLQNLHYPEDEPSTLPVSRYDFEFEGQLLTGSDLKDLIYEEILLYHFNDKMQQYQRDKAEFDQKHGRKQDPNQESGNSDPSSDEDML